MKSKKDYNKEYYQKYKKQFKKQRRAYYLKNKEKELIYAKQYRAKHKKHYSKLARTHNLRIKFGITEQDYNKIIQKQKGTCAICKHKEKKIHHCTNKIQNLCVDHNHKTNKIRGLLCNNCNACLGWYENHKQNVDKYIKS